MEETFCGKDQETVLGGVDPSGRKIGVGPGFQVTTSAEGSEYPVFEENPYDVVGRGEMDDLRLADPPLPLHPLSEQAGEKTVPVRQGDRLGVLPGFCGGFTFGDGEGDEIQPREGETLGVCRKEGTVVPCQEVPLREWSLPGGGG